MFDRSIVKDAEFMKKRLPIGFENFPEELQDIFICHIECSINVDELSNELINIRKILYEKKKNYFREIEKFNNTSEKIKNYFKRER